MNLTNKVLIELPCTSRNSVHFMNELVNIHQFICITPYKSNVNFVHKYLANKSSYVYGHIHQLSKLKLPKTILEPPNFLPLLS